MGVSNVLFGFLLKSYIASLEALQQVSQCKENKGDLLSEPSFPKVPALEKADYDTTTRKKTGRPSLDRWDEAVSSALRAQELLWPAEDGTSEELDRRSKEGMRYLAHSVEVIPRFRGMILEDVVADSEILSWAEGIVDKFFENKCTIEAAQAPTVFP